MYANRSIANWQRSRKRTRRAELVLRIRGSAYNSVLLLISDKTLNVRLYFSLSLSLSLSLFPLPPFSHTSVKRWHRGPTRTCAMTLDDVYFLLVTSALCSYTFFWFRGETIERPFHASASSRFSRFEFHAGATRRREYIFVTLPFIIFCLLPLPFPPL